MSYLIGLDIGGTKIAAAALSESGEVVANQQCATPQNYKDFLHACRALIERLNVDAVSLRKIGVGITGVFDYELGKMSQSANLPFLQERFFLQDLQNELNSEVRLANDANCAALAEAIDGAGKGYRSVFGMIMGTGIGGALIYKQQLIDGANGMSCEIGHLPLPQYSAEDGPHVPCGCGRPDCLEPLINGAGLARRYEAATGVKADGIKIAELARQKDPTALRVLDGYYETVAKAMVTIMHALDPDIIVISGGLNNLPGLFEQVPQRWGKYALTKTPKTKLARAQHGAMAGLRGAAWLCR